MIDIALLRTAPEQLKEMLRLRGSQVDLDRLIAVDSDLRRCQTKVETLRADRNRMSKEARASADVESAKRIKSELQAEETRCRELQEERNRLLAQVPNLLAPDTPQGTTDGENLELRRWGHPRPAGVPAHEEIGRKLGILDLERGATVAASGFYYWRGDGARLAWAVFSFALDLLQRRGFEPFLTPLLARPSVFFGTGYLPFFDGETYKIQGTDLALIGTSEQTLIGYFGDQFVPVEALPIRATAFSACFRTEAGAAGRASRGAFRVHQFHKVEQIVICRPDESEKMLQVCQQNAEDLLQAMEIPYRVVRVCIGDLGAPAYKKLDTEAWFPGFGEYRETHSNSNLLDYQARRFDIRYKEDGKRVFPHTISATGITDRAVLAIIENHYQDDGRVRVPQVLRPYLGGVEFLAPGVR